MVVNATVNQNTPYAVNYPLPGPSGSVGYKTAQATSTVTEMPVVTPPTIAILRHSGTGGAGQHVLRHQRGHAAG